MVWDTIQPTLGELCYMCSTLKNDGGNVQLSLE